MGNGRKLPRRRLIYRDIDNVANMRAGRTPGAMSPACKLCTYRHWAWHVCWSRYKRSLVAHRTWAAGDLAPRRFYTSRGTGLTLGTPHPHARRPSVGRCLQPRVNPRRTPGFSGFKLSARTRMVRQQSAPSARPQSTIRRNADSARTRLIRRK
jgi:hypothetical protein